MREQFPADLLLIGFRKTGNLGDGLFEGSYHWDTVAQFRP